MNLDLPKDSLLKELETLRQEIGELRSVESMHQETQEGLRAIEVQLAGIIHSAMDGIITINEKQEIILFNAAAEKMFGCSAKEALGQSIDQFIPDRYRAHHAEHVKAFGETHVTNRRMGALGKISGLRTNGEEFPIEASISQVERGNHRLYTVILRDITERLRAEHELQETQRMLATLMANLPGMAYRCCDDQQWTMEFVSDGCFDLTGYAAQDLIGNRKVSYGRDLIHVDDQRRVWEEVQKAIRVRKPFQLLYRIVTPDSSIKWVWEQGSGVYSPEGEVLAIEGLISDITEQKLLEQRLRHTERLAEMGTLASGMAHEIGTPMNVILGRAEYLMRKTTEEPTQKGLATIVTQVERITKIMNQLLSFARRRPIERRPLALGSVVHDIVDVVQDRMQRRNITLELALNAKDQKVFADRDQMGQVILNLVMNAIQAMPGGGTLKVSLKVEKKLAHLSIADTGCGIPKENLSKLFTPFFTTKEVGEGTGLGLTVVHGIIEEHEGTIKVESKVDKGSTFIISLPIYQPSKHSSKAER